VIAWSGTPVADHWYRGSGSQSGTWPTTGYVTAVRHPAIEETLPLCHNIQTYSGAHPVSCPSSSKFSFLGLKRHKREADKSHLCSEHVIQCEMWGSHHDEDEDRFFCNVTPCSVVDNDRRFRTALLPPSSGCNIPEVKPLHFVQHFLFSGDVNTTGTVLSLWISLKILTKEQIHPTSCITYNNQRD
jgi:hypothetical protein